MFLFCLFLFIFFSIWGFREGGCFEIFFDRCCFDLFEVGALADGVSLVCLSMLFMCGTTALIYSGHYFLGEPDGRVLSVMLGVFLIVMAFLVFSFGLLSTLIMWEYLGVVSFFLILFYSNLDSMRATLITVFASRFGDVCLFGLLVFSVFWFDEGGVLFSVLILLIALTKSACFPFISWLLEAMRAPTPVSSLVHSSTLVAAGVWFLFRYGGSVFVFSSGLETVLLVLAFCTVLISSFCSVVFLDLKKIVALSTCNNISWCIIFFLFGDVFLGLFQLMCHGVSKCYLFISLGDLMSFSSSGQDCRGVYCSGYGSFYLLCVQFVLLLSLTGLPFLGVFFSKHGLVAELLWGFSTPGLVILFFCFLMSYVYSLRLFCLLCGFSSFGVFGFGSLFLLIFFLPLLSGVLNFFCLGGVEELYSLGRLCSFSLLFVQCVGCFYGFYLYYYYFPRWFSLLGFLIWGCENIVGAFYFIFSSCLRFFLFLMYRWEVFTFCYLSYLLNKGGLVFGFSWRSLKFMVLGGLFMLGFFLLIV